MTYVLFQFRQVPREIVELSRLKSSRPQQGPVQRSVELGRRFLSSDRGKPGAQARLRVALLI